MEATRTDFEQRRTIPRAWGTTAAGRRRQRKTYHACNDSRLGRSKDLPANGRHHTPVCRRSYTTCGGAADEPAARMEGNRTSDGKVNMGCVGPNL